MENTTNNYVESKADLTTFEDHQSNFNLQAMNSSSPNEEDENEDEDKGEDSNEGSEDSDPPLDDNVVHSPVPPQTGGRGK